MRRQIHTLLLLMIAFSVDSSAVAQGPVKKVALLAGVNVYQKRGFKNLDYAERDVSELEKELTKLGFKTVLLTGSADGDLKATRKNIDAQLVKLLADTGKQDIVMVVLSGHGQQLIVRSDDGKEREDGFFCCYDAEKDNPKTQFSLSYLTDDLLAKKGGKNLVVVDACRDVPKDAGRGGRGVQGKIVSLPENTAIFFSCSAEQESWENDELKHGVFSYCLLEGLRGQAAKGGEISWPNLVAHVDDRMASNEMKKYLKKPQEPISAGGVGRTVLGRIGGSPISFEGKVAGEGKELVQGIKFHWCPAGNFTMGSPTSEAGRSEDEDQVTVTLSQGFWLGETELTQGQWQDLMGTTPWKGQQFVKEGRSYAASYVSYEDAVAYCEKLTTVERSSGRLPQGWKYTLPTEAQWEYACRSGTKTKYSFGADETALGDYGWFNKNGLDAGEKYAHEVGKKKSTLWGLTDMHGNVREWCSDWYDKKLMGGRDPVGALSGSYRAYRGGSWNFDATLCRSACRWYYSPDFWNFDLGFRLALVPSSQ